jgi:hypothetical protein
MRLPLAICVTLVAPAAMAGLLDQVPVANETLRGDFAKLASCAYVALDASEGAGVKKIDLPNESRLALESGGVRYWQLVFTSVGRGQTRVEFSEVQTIWGTQKAPRVMPAVRACAAD